MSDNKLYWIKLRSETEEELREEFKAFCAWAKEKTSKRVDPRGWTGIVKKGEVYTLANQGEETNSVSYSAYDKPENAGFSLINYHDQDSTKEESKRVECIPDPPEIIPYIYNPKALPEGEAKRRLREFEKANGVEDCIEYEPYGYFTYQGGILWYKTEEDLPAGAIKWIPVTTTTETIDVSLLTKHCPFIDKICRNDCAAYTIKEGVAVCLNLA